jgi:signal transduction histidine kinase
MRTVLLAGFGLTFGIWLYAGNYFLDRISDIENRTAVVNVRYMQAQERLSTVRAQVLLASVYVRDALLDPNRAAADYLVQVNAAYDSVSQALDQYVPVLDSTDERARVERLRKQIDDFRESMVQVLGADSRTWPADARTLLNTIVVPKREMVIRVSEEVQALNRAAFVQQQREVAEIYSLSQRRLWQTLGGALAASFGVALLAAMYAGRLESRLTAQRTREAHYARELEDLSAKLITVQEEERRSIARELHDEVGQALTAIKVELAVAQRAVEAGRADTRSLSDARSITEGALAAVRDLSHLLHPVLLDDLGLPAAIEWYLRGFGRRYGIRCDFSQTGPQYRLAQDVESSSYRIVQEALTNVAKHARATVCDVRLECSDTRLRLTIDDDGVGFDDRARDAGNERRGLGLIGIRERATQLGGTVAIETAPGRGTRLTVELPARRREKAETDQVPASPQTVVVGDQSHG